MEKNIIVKIHKSYRNVISICDGDLLGKKFEEENKQLDLSGKFYEGEKVNEEELREIIFDWIKEDATFNIVGEKSIRIGLNLGIISEEGVKRIQNIPFSFVLL